LEAVSSEIASAQAHVAKLQMEFDEAHAADQSSLEDLSALRKQNAKLEEACLESFGSKKERASARATISQLEADAEELNKLSQANSAELDQASADGILLRAKLASAQEMLADSKGGGEEGCCLQESAVAVQEARVRRLCMALKDKDDGAQIAQVENDPGDAALDSQLQQAAEHGLVCELEGSREEGMRLRGELEKVQASQHDLEEDLASARATVVHARSELAQASTCRAPQASWAHAPRIPGRIATSMSSSDAKRQWLPALCGAMG